jgi:hypothetical protein
MLFMHHCSSLDINPLTVLKPNTASDTFGYAVSTSGDTIVVGDYDDNYGSNAGAAYVFVRDGTSWTQQAYLKASNTEEDDWFGYSVSISGDTKIQESILIQEHERWQYLGSTSISKSQCIFISIWKSSGCR